MQLLRATLVFIIFDNYLLFIFTCQSQFFLPPLLSSRFPNLSPTPPHPFLSLFLRCCVSDALQVSFLSLALCLRSVQAYKNSPKLFPLVLRGLSSHTCLHLCNSLLGPVYEASLSNHMFTLLLPEELRNKSFHFLLWSMGDTFEGTLKWVCTMASTAAFWILHVCGSFLLFWGWL